jgi:hypothetical protein
MLDRIARAIDPSAFAEHDGAGTYNWASRRRVALMRARRAVEAMRELTDDIPRSGMMKGATDTWRGLIEEILK